MRHPRVMEIKDKPCPDCGKLIMRKSEKCISCVKRRPRGAYGVHRESYRIDIHDRIYQKGGETDANN